MHPPFVLYEAEVFLKIKNVCEALAEDANAMAVFLIDASGQILATAGDASDIDTASLASLTAGNVADQQHGEVDQRKRIFLTGFS